MADENKTAGLLTFVNLFDRCGVNLNCGILNNFSCFHLLYLSFSVILQFLMHVLLHYILLNNLFLFVFDIVAKTSVFVLIVLALFVTVII
jgi:hypothetical protein